MSLFLPARSLLAAAAAALLLAACSTVPVGDGATSTRSNTGDTGTQTGGRDPLLDAPNRTLMTCTTVSPITVLQRVNEMPFSCPALGVSATINELRDAGWRILRLDIGEDSESDSHVGFPVTIQVRKLF